ncbi:LPXTG-domain-containing protein cell wall anchor domain [Enterococcus haemoperoxidus ATCC BAA-382]|uniref:LPXTG-domain-containing protein cell wall anchor domain n=1 Tax=Enterococcus haemoperoxidus ATCC BAA-382 TaxID=1158608 RepID=R2TA39_9ENTE|nr:LPXTG cell wall anchor domain-containing protein [Enterococcus haemoperoxidus]EOH97094.1 LPXTG-domain-containing protein cell wall anchor domain [Enterococcus haemoperoxidus ATCC BAA-382]EOT59907.1 hypothetical protein I583_02542 [Enterococcus haemoperoxidus ATCC BAA-382]OJG56087.1 LPXTG-domain-containing protein cell wall anchor domain [Enterococcus haemoperoxidus]
MKNRKGICLFITSILFSMMLFILPMKSLGSEGAVQTKGEVTLINGTTATSGSPTSTTKDASLPNTKGQSQKPIGRLPSTGELVQKSLTISGILILLIFLTAYFLRKKNKQSERKKGRIDDE